MIYAMDGRAGSVGRSRRWKEKKASRNPENLKIQEFTEIEWDRLQRTKKTRVKS